MRSQVAESEFSKGLAEGQAAEDAMISEFEKFMEDAKVKRATMMQDQKNKTGENLQRAQRGCAAKPGPVEGCARFRREPRRSVRWMEVDRDRRD